MNGIVFGVYLSLLVIGAIPALTFPVYYSVTTKWWRMPRGHVREMAGHLVTFSTLFALLYVRGAMRVSNPSGRRELFDQSPGSVAFLLFIAMLAAFVGWQRVWIFHRSRKSQEPA